MPTVYIWMPNDEHKYGHVSLETDKYYTSIWPRGDIKRNKQQMQALVGGVDADIIYHRDYDYFLEGKRQPIVLKLHHISDDKINKVYEALLTYNGIDPRDVTLNAAERQIEQFQLFQKDDYRPEKPLSRTRYALMSFKAAPILLDAMYESMSNRDSGWSFQQEMIRREERRLFRERILSTKRERFYDDPQSCTLFALHLLESAIDTSVFDSQYEGIKLSLLVPGFKNILETYYMEGYKPEPKKDEGSCTFL